jgi:hypothetical protein
MGGEVMTRDEAIGWLADTLDKLGHKPEITDSDRVQPVWDAVIRRWRSVPLDEGDTHRKAIRRECAAFVSATEGVTWGHLSDR